MPDLHQVLSSLLISVARAREVADFQSAVIAEQYRSNPLLEGLSAPRIRFGEIEIELPLMIDSAAQGVPNKLRDPMAIATELAPVVMEVAASEGLTLGPDVHNELLRRLEADLKTTAGRSGLVGSELVPKEVISRQAQQAVRDVLLGAPGTELDPGALRAVLDAVSLKAQDVAEVDSGSLPSLAVNVLTSEVKEKTSPASVTRLRIVLTEEGLEWSSHRAPDGITKRTLTPE